MKMATWLHTAVLATAIAATAAIGLASAALIVTAQSPSAKADRLAAVAATGAYRTIETRSAGVSVLTRVLVD
jgi:hypothetical protein